jgi:thiol-disulfide isomerase/thioredoxin
MKKEEVMVKKSAGMYVPYSADKLALAKDNKVVIFFHAGWCPSCRALDAEIVSKGVKEGYVILKADYDSSKELKAKYGVTSQHTLVQVNTTGTSITKWTGGDLAGIYAKAK